jgi:glycosyltransferase involved in cell wall biosynthesis
MSSPAASRGANVPDGAEGSPEAGIVFVLPPGDPPSGGDLYNRFLLRALRAEGCRFDSLTLARLRPGAFPPRTEFWVDSLYIRDMGEADPFGPDDRLFFIIHSLPSEDPGLPPSSATMLRKIEDRLFARASGFLATGPLTRDTLRARRVAGPILLVPPAPCVLPKGPLKAPAIFTGLIVSSLIRGKGVPDLLDVLGREVRPSDDFRLRIAGRTDIERGTAASCLAAVKAHPLLSKRVVHLGFVPYEELAEEYERSSALIHPSSREGYGMAFHEARFFGLPILAVRAPYSEPFIEAGRTGLLFSSAADLARGVLDLVRKPEEMERLAAAASQGRPAAGYTWADAARSFLSQRDAYDIFRSA